MFTRSLFVLICLPLLLAVVPNDPAHRLPNSSNDCFRTTPFRPPWYAVSATWMKDGTVLAVVEPSTNKLLFYTNVGDYISNLSDLPSPLTAILGRFFPSAVANSDEHLLLEVANRHFLRLDDNLRPVHTSAGVVQTIEPRNRSHQTLRSMALWTLAGDDFVSCGDYVTDDGQWTSGIARVPIQNPDAFHVLTESSISDPTWLFCRLGFDYLTSLGNNAYVFLMQDSPGLFISRPGATDLERLPSFPSDYVPYRPDLTNFSSLSGFAQTLRQTESESMIVGIWGWEHNIYALYRTPNRQGSTDWTLLRLDPTTGALKGGPSRLPTHSPHLLVVPGPLEWAIFEKDEPVSLGNQPTKSFLFIPSEKLRGALPASLCPNLESPE